MQWWWHLQGHLCMSNSKIHQTWRAPFELSLYFQIWRKCNVSIYLQSQITNPSNFAKIWWLCCGDIEQPESLLLLPNLEKSSPPIWPKTHQRFDSSPRHSWTSSSFGHGRPSLVMTSEGQAHATSRMWRAQDLLQFGGDHWICKQIVGNLDPLLVHMCLTGRPLFEREKNSRNITDIACVSLLCTFPGGPERCLVSSGSPFHYLGLNEWRMEHSSFFYTNPRHYDSDRRPQNESGFNRQDEVLVKKNALSWREGANIWCQVPFRFLKCLLLRAKEVRVNKD